MKIFIIFGLLVFIIGSGNAQLIRFKIDTLKASAAIKIKGVDRTTLFDRLDSDNRTTTNSIGDGTITRPKLSTTVNVLLNNPGSGIAHPPDDITLEFKIAGLDTSVGITSNYLSDSLDTINFSEISPTVGNLLYDPSFEYGAFGSSTWYAATGYDQGVYLYLWRTNIKNYLTNDRGWTFTTRSSYHGNTCLEYSYSSDLEAASETNQAAQPIRCDTSAEYTFSIYAKRDTSAIGTNITFRIMDVDTNGTPGNITSINLKDSLTTSWDQYSVTFTTASDAAFVVGFLAVFAFTDTNDSMWVDAASIVTGSTPYVWTMPEHIWNVTNDFKSFHVDYLNSKRLLVTNTDPGSIAPLAVFRDEGLDSIPTQRSYRSMVEFQAGDGAWNSKIDQRGNIWVSQNFKFVTGNVNGVSSGHFFNDLDDMTTMGLGTSNGFLFTSSPNYIVYRYWNDQAVAQQLLYGTIGFGHDYDKGNKTTSSEQTFAEELSESPMYIEKWGMKFNSGNFQIPYWTEWFGGNYTGQIQVDTTRMRLYTWREDSAAWFYTTMTKDTNVTFIPPNNLRLWMRGQDLMLAYADSDTVNIWKDVAGYALHAEMDTNSYAPVVHDSVINNHPALFFDGDDYMIIPNNWLAAQDDSITIFIVFNRTTAGGGVRNMLTFFENEVLAMGVNSSNFFYGRANTGSLGDGPMWAWDSTDVGSDSWHYGMLQAAPSGNVLELDGGANLGGTLGSGPFNLWDNQKAPTLGTHNYSKVNYYYGYIAEILVYNTKLSVSDIALIEAYFLAKFGI